MSELPNETEFRPALMRDALRHHIALILGLAIVLAAVAAAAGIYLPSARKSTAVVLVNPLYGNPFSPDATGDQLTNLTTEAQLVSTDAVASIVKSTLKSPLSVSDLDRTVSATVTTNTQVVQITYSASSARTAHDRAQAFADAFLTYRQQRAEALIDSQVKLLKAQQSSTRSELTKATGQLASSKATSTQSLATEQVRTYTAELTRLTSAIAEEQATPTDPGQVISPASTPADVQLSTGILYGGAGLIVGLILGLLAAITMERLDDRVRGRDDLDRLSITSLGDMTIAPGWSPTVREVPEDHRRVRTALLSSLPTVPATIVIGRPGTANQAPSIVGPLALALARSGVRVAVVDAAITDWLGQDLVPHGEAGLASVLLSDTPVETVLQQPVPGLWVVPRGRWTNEAADRLGNVRMRRAISALRKHFDVVIICTTGMQNADGQVLSRMADGVLLESTVMNTTNAELLQTVEQLNRAGIPVMGSVLVHVSASRRRQAARQQQGADAGPPSGRPTGGAGLPGESPFPAPANGTPPTMAVPVAVSPFPPASSSPSRQDS